MLSLYYRRSKHGNKGSGSPDEVSSSQGPSPSKATFKPVEMYPELAERSSSIDDEEEGESSCKGEPKVFLSTIAKRLLDQAAEKQDLNMSFSNVPGSPNLSPKISIVMSAPSSPRGSRGVSAPSSPRMITISSAPSSPRFGTALSVQDAIKTLRSRTPSPQLQEMAGDEAVRPIYKWSWIVKFLEQSVTLFPQANYIIFSYFVLVFIFFILKSQA